MNQIQVPNNFKHLLREGRAQKDNDQRKLDIKRIICENEGKPITGADFVEATGTTSANLHLKRLMREGYITRKPFKHGGAGRKYQYSWHNIPLEPKTATLKNGGTVTSTLNLPDLPMSETELRALHKSFHLWIDEANITGDEIIAVMRFHKWMVDRCRMVTEQRQIKIKQHIDGKEY